MAAESVLNLGLAIGRHPRARRVLSFAADAFGLSGQTRRHVNVVSALRYFRENPSARSYLSAFPEVYPPGLTVASADRLLRHYDMLLVDLYGVVENSSGVMAEAVSALRKAAESGKQLFFVSNTGDRLPEKIVEKYRALGLDIKVDQVITSGMTLGGYFRRRGLVGAEIINVGDEDVCAEYIRRAGGIPLPHAGIMKSYSRAKGVVVGYQRGFPVEVENAAINAMLRFGIPAVVTNTDEVAPYSETEVTLACASKAVEIERYSGRKVDKLGKPDLYGYAYGIAESAGYGKNRNRVLVIGDSLEMDVLGAQRNGFDSLLVLSGLHKQMGQIAILERIMSTKGIFPTYLLPVLG